MNDTVYAASSIGNCPKRLSCHRLGIPPTPRPLALELAAEEGNLHEQSVKNKLRREGYSIVSEQLEYKLSCPSPVFSIVGHIDGKAATRDVLLLLEIKSMSEFQFRKWMKGRWEAFPGYADQLTIYMAMTEICQCLYCVKNRNTGYLDRNIIEQFPSSYAAIIAKLSHIECLALENKCAEANYDPEQSECRYCEYAYLCAKNIPAIEASDVELLEAANDWRKGKELEFQSKELLETSSATFLSHAKAIRQKKFTCDKLHVNIVSFIRTTYNSDVLQKTFTAEQLKPAKKDTPVEFPKITDLAGVE